MKKKFWKIYYKYFEPRNKAQLLNKWERLDYFNFAEIEELL